LGYPLKWRNHFQWERTQIFLWILIKSVKKTLEAYTKSLKVIGWSLIIIKIKEKKILKDIKAVVKLNFGFRENVTWNNENVTKN
jgi:hypothetical protein